MNPEINHEADLNEDEFVAVAPDGEQSYPSELQVAEDEQGMRLDHFLVAHLADVSRVRVQQLIAQEKITIGDKAVKSSLKLKGGERIAILGEVALPPLKAFPEDIPLDVVFEDRDFAVINKPAGMVVHAGSGNSEDPRNRGTLVNALMFRFQRLSGLGGELRPGIVHRLDKDTSGLLVVAKNDHAHHNLADQFASRKVRKRYIALVHNWPAADQGTVNAPVARDPQNRTRMTTRDPYGREAVSHYTVLERFASPYGRFALIEVKIDTGRTHQIRVHMSSIGFPVVGDTLYGAPAALSPHTLDRERQGNAISLRNQAKRARQRGDLGATLVLGRNFLHSFAIDLKHPRSGEPLSFSASLPPELEEYLQKLRPELEEPVSEALSDEAPAEGSSTPKPRATAKPRSVVSKKAAPGAARKTAKKSSRTVVKKASAKSSSKTEARTGTKVKPAKKQAKTSFRKGQ